MKRGLTLLIIYLLMSISVSFTIRPAKLWENAIAQTRVDTFENDSNKKKKKIKIRGLGRYKKDLKVMCYWIGKDGRGDYFYKIVKEAKIKILECPACKPMASLFASACKPKKIKKKKKQKTAHNKNKPNSQKKLNIKPPPKQRIPHIVVIDRASMIAIDMAQREDASYLKQGLEYINSQVLQKISSPAEKEYFNILFTYLLSPFK